MTHEAAMERNFTDCPHCALKGKSKTVQPSVRDAPLVSRSDSRTYHLYLEERVFHRQSNDPQIQPEIWALFRYDLDSNGIKAESSGVIVPGDERDHEKLEQAADLLGALLGQGITLRRRYKLVDGRLV